MKLCILKNEDENSHKKWELSCKNKNLAYSIVDLTSYNWFEEIRNCDADIFLLKPPGETLKFKTLYDERLFIVSKVLNKFTFPSYEEVLIYENKRMLAQFLKASNIPMPETNIFHKKDEAINFLKKAKLPIVAKTVIGASGSGVKIIKNRKELSNYIKTGFTRGIKRRLGPNRKTGNVKSWAKKAMNSPLLLKNKIKQYLTIYKDTQKGVLIFQEFIAHDYEWRIVKIGDSWFGHQKVKSGDKASGTKGIDYIAPSTDLLNFCFDLCEKNGFNSMAIDLFERGSGEYVVNELQTIFGHVQSHILEVDGKVGRYKRIKDKWVFEEGDFNTNESYDLRLETALSLYKHRVVNA